LGLPKFYPYNAFPRYFRKQLNDKYTADMKAIDAYPAELNKIADRLKAAGQRILAPFQAEVQNIYNRAKPRAESFEGTFINGLKEIAHGVVEGSGGEEHEPKLEGESLEQFSRPLARNTLNVSKIRGDKQVAKDDVAAQKQAAQAQHQTATGNNDAAVNNQQNAVPNKVWETFNSWIALIYDAQPTLLREACVCVCVCVY